MGTTKSQVVWGGGVVVVVVTAISVWLAYGRENQPPALPPEKFMDAFKAADKVDQENWDRMWRDAGKQPPPRR